MELLVRIVDKKGVAAVDASKRGDVIAAVPDGWQWSAAELANNDWRIIRCNVPQTFADAVISGVMASRRRDWSIDLDRLPAPGLYKGPRTRGVIDVDADHLLRTTQKKIVA